MPPSSKQFLATQLKTVVAHYHKSWTICR